MVGGREEGYCFTLYTFKSKTRRDKISHVSNIKTAITTTQQQHNNNTTTTQQQQQQQQQHNKTHLVTDGGVYCHILGHKSPLWGENSICCILLCPCGSCSLVSRLLHCKTARENSERRSQEMRLLGLVCIWWLGWSTMLFTEYELRLCTLEQVNMVNIPMYQLWTFITFIGSKFSIVLL